MELQLIVSLGGTGFIYDTSDVVSVGLKDEKHKYTYGDSYYDDRLMHIHMCVCVCVCEVCLCEDRFCYFHDILLIRNDLATDCMHFMQLPIPSLPFKIQYLKHYFSIPVIHTLSIFFLLLWNICLRFSWSFTTFSLK